MFKIKDIRVLNELKRAGVSVQEFLDEIATHEDNETIIFYNEENDKPFITYNTFYYRRWLEEKTGTKLNEKFKNNDRWKYIDNKLQTSNNNPFENSTHYN